ncbi:hypothetical protein J7I80_02100, partial [Bacillus sp. ISL-41]|uniref:hypothetical protein n=1 Tax=Bacillus sp. ISL-41 TaxID=2819127 RepID=UPI001BE7747C
MALIGQLFMLLLQTCLELYQVQTTFCALPPNLSEFRPNNSVAALFHRSSINQHTKKEQPLQLFFRVPGGVLL